MAMRRISRHALAARVAGGISRRISRLAIGNELQDQVPRGAFLVRSRREQLRAISDVRSPIWRCRTPQGSRPLAFERKCPTGLRGGRSPNLDVLLTGANGIIGIESKLTSFWHHNRASFSPAYAEQIRDARREQGYFLEMQRLTEAPEAYAWLDAAQLIKHAFGLAGPLPASA